MTCGSRNVTCNKLDLLSMMVCYISFFPLLKTTNVGEDLNLVMNYVYKNRGWSKILHFDRKKKKKKSWILVLAKLV